MSLNRELHDVPRKKRNVQEMKGTYCWKGCGELGSFFHAWQSCKYILQFWLHVLVLIKTITGFTVPRDPVIILLNIWDHTTIPDTTRELIFLLLLAAKSSIAFYWRKPVIPSIDFWLQKIWDFIIFDKVLVSFNTRKNPNPLYLYGNCS